MDRDSRSELIKTIESQNEKISKYERKLRDIVGAYKGLLKEKEALEASVNALSAATAVNAADVINGKDARDSKVTEDAAPNSDVAVTNSEANNDSKAPSEVSDESTEEGSSAGHVWALRAQLATLSASLATLTHEKSKMEASYQAEKKKLRQEHEAFVEEKEALDETQRKTIQQLTEELQMWRSKVRGQQHEREKEQDDHAVMLRELQKLLAAERMAKEHMEHQLDEMKQALSEAKSSTDVTDRYEARIQELGREIGHLRESLAVEKERAKQPSPEVLQLEERLRNMEAEHRTALRQEQNRANYAEERVGTLSGQSEERVASLEAKLSELSEATGKYERQHTQDQMNIQRLRERITQLDMENTALAKAAHGGRGRSPGGEMEEEEGMGVQEIMDRMVRLKKMLKAANEKLDKPIDIEELLKIDASSFDHESLHTKCREDYDQLKEEFERYKLRAQSVLKNKSTKEPVSNAKEVESLRQQVSELKERLRQMRRSYDEMEQELNDKEEHFRKTLTALTDKHKIEIISIEADHKQKVGEIELEMRKHRDRTIALLAEKDRELEILRSLNPVDKYEQQYIGQFSPSRQVSQTSSVDIQEAGASSEESNMVSELLARTSLAPGNPSDSSLLFFAQEQARKDVEINNLRRQKHTLEQSLRELTQDFAMKEQHSSEREERLQEEIRKLERNKSRESANLEYLKNVVYHFMMCHDTVGRQQMTNAIATILEFSPKERHNVHSVLNKGWWSYAQGSTAK